ncbi:MAG: 23S rRNA (pseudouridine(1915)-N(3))-methyltransferase RlmH [Flavobacterium sp.]|nr:23S rRNA (pseudouridine(1915)-N(3))-methyltransferase RlmH [Flavobacterium sp.]
MKFTFISIGKKNNSDIEDAVNDYTKRISRHFQVEWKLIQTSDKEGEAKSILKTLDSEDFVVALDDKGKELNTIELSQFIEKRMIAGDKKVVFVIGGAYGIHESIYKRANFKWSLSKLTFPHQLVRLILAEALYRAISVIKKEPYHHA